MEKKFLQKLTIPQFIRTVELSKKQRPKYIKAKGRKAFPKACRRTDGTVAKDSIGYLINPDTGERLLKNPGQAGKPRLKILNGNDFTYGFKNQYEKDVVVKKLKEYLLSQMIGKLETFEYSDFPLYIEFFMVENVLERGENWDIGNEWFWSKYMEDNLSELGLIPDDSVEFIIKSAGPPILIPTLHNEERCLMWDFFKSPYRAHTNYWPWTKKSTEIPNLKP